MYEQIKKKIEKANENLYNEEIKIIIKDLEYSLKVQEGSTKLMEYLIQDLLDYA